MKTIQLVVLMLSLYACNNTLDNNTIYEYPNLKNAFLTSIVFSRWSSKQVYVYNEFDNIETKDIINSIYRSYNEDLGYSINDSILNHISNRGNRQISKSLIDKEDLSVILISDTTKYVDYIIFSEPFSINNKWMCFSISRKDSDSKTRKHYVFYVEKDKEKDQFDVPFIYDWQKDILLEKSVIK